MTIQNYTENDEQYILGNLRDIDLAEMELLYPGSSPSALVAHALRVSTDKFTFIDEHGVPAGIGGIAPNHEEPGFFVWFIGSKTLETTAARRNLLKAGRRYLNARLNTYQRLHNYCGPSKLLHRALRLLGFSISPTHVPKIFRLEICV